MPTYLDRYLAGEYEQVWDELMALGAAVREEPLYSDARAVTRETMRRVRANIETLVPRWEAIGYKFGYAWAESLARVLNAWDHEQRRQMIEEDGLSPNDPLLAEWEDPGDEILSLAGSEEPILSPPKPGVGQRLAKLERMVGHIPLSLRAWYEGVGGVNFVGTAPAGWWPPIQYEHGERDPDPRDRFVADLAGRTIGLDPIYLYSLDRVMSFAAIDLRHMRRLARTGQSTVSHIRYLDFGPDVQGKSYSSGSGPYAIEVPNGGMDAPMLRSERYNTTFVGYLRLCLRWGGLPGLQQLHPPPAELTFITKGLLPI
jgi:hypothetical protein